MCRKIGDDDSSDLTYSTRDGLISGSAAHPCYPLYSASPDFGWGSARYINVDPVLFTASDRAGTYELAVYGYMTLSETLETTGGV